MFFWNSLAFSMIQRMLSIWSLVPLPFLKPAWTSRSSRFTYCWNLGLENFEHYSTSMWDECNCEVIWAFFCIAFLWNWNENWLFPVLWPLLSFPNLLAYWVQHFHSITLRYPFPASGTRWTLITLCYARSSFQPLSWVEQIHFQYLLKAFQLLHRLIECDEFWG